MEMFSTHLRIHDSNGSLIRYTYEIDKQLEKNFTDLFNSDPNDNEEYWAWKFLTICHKDLPDLLAVKHMSAYLGKFIVNPARRIHRKLSNYQQYTQYQYDIGDVLQIGLLIACDSTQFFPRQFFRNFHQGRPLRNYVYKTMERKIDEMIRQQMGQSRLSKWGLLKYSSRTYLRKALEQEYTEQQLNTYLLAYDCFKEVYAQQRPTSERSLPSPTNQQFQEITNLYNQQTTFGIADIAQIEQWLSICIQALRKYQTIPVISLDAPSGGNEHSSPLSETIIDETSNSQEERLIIQEQTPQLIAILSEFLNQIDQTIDHYLLLRYGLEAKYRAIAPIFAVHYTNISRPCNQAKQKLLSQLAQWSQKELNITPDSEMLAQMNAPLEGCLIHYYQDLIFRSVFQQVWQQLDSQRQYLLYLRYCELKDEAAIAHELQMDPSQVREGLQTGDKQLADAITNWLQKRLSVSSHLLNPLAENIADLVRTLVKNISNSEF
jgi:RNA polymerase sigma factor (sigma-70 family)